MTRAVRLALALALLGTVVGLASTPRTAHAEPPNPRAAQIYVLSIWTDDADDTADALTQALRSRVRGAEGWSLQETPQSFETLTIALKCPAKPDPPCLQRIGDQLHAERYVWGTMARRKSGQVTAEMHFWSRGKGSAEAAESYAENLKDAGDQSLREIASRLFGRLTGGIAGGTLVVHAGKAGGSVIVDGVHKASLENGVARLDLGGGLHTIGVRVSGFDAPAQQASVSPGGENALTFTLSPAAPDATEPEPHKPFPTRDVATYSALAVGAGLLVAGGVEGLVWLDDSNTSKADRKGVPPSVTNVCETAVNAAAIDACQKSHDAVTVSTLAWVFTGVGAALLGTGVVLLRSGHGPGDRPHDAATVARQKPSLALLPLLGPRSGALDLRVTF
jgi:hypothetical protein